MPNSKVRRTLDLLTTAEYLALLNAIVHQRRHIAESLANDHSQLQYHNHARYSKEDQALDRAALKIAQIIEAQ